MRCRFVILIIAAALAIQAFGQAQAPRIPRMPDGKPNLTGLWQALGTPNWDIRDHIAQPGPFIQLGAVGAMPGGQGIVEGGEIPYKPEAAAKQKEKFLDRLKLDPVVKFYMPGVPPVAYMPFSLQIIQFQKDIASAYQYATS